MGRASWPAQLGNRSRPPVEDNRHDRQREDETVWPNLAGLYHVYERQRELDRVFAVPYLTARIRCVSLRAAACRGSLPVLCCTSLQDLL